MSKQCILEFVQMIGTIMSVIGLLLLTFTPTTECVLYKVGAVIGALGFIALFAATIMFPIPPCDKK